MSFTPLFDAATLSFVVDAWSSLLTDALWKGTLLLTLAGGVSVLLRRGAAAIRHLIWTLSLVALILLPTLGAVVPHWEILPAGWRLADSAPVLMESVPAGQFTPSDQADPAFAEVRLGSRQTDTVAPALAMASPPEPVGSIWSLELVLFLLWEAGTLLVLVFFALGRFQLDELQRSAVPVAEETRRHARRLQRELGLSGVRLLESDRVSAPVTWGIRRPVIVLPAGNAGWSISLQRDVLLHELAHVQRRDALTQGLAQLACALFWFHPLVWGAARQMRQERERACDDRVVAQGSKPSSYAAHLVEIARSVGEGRPLPRASLAMACRPQLSTRVSALLDPRVRRRGTGRWSWTTATALAVMAAAVLAAIGPAHAVRDGDELSSKRIQERYDDPDAFRFSGKSSWTHTDDDYRLKVRLRGTIVFRGDESDVLEIERGGSLEIEERREGERRRIEIEPGRDGQLERRYFVGRRQQDYDDEAARWLAQVLSDYLSQTSFGSSERMARIYAQGGFEALSARLSQAEGDFALASGLITALELEKVSDDERVELLTRFTPRIDSDFELARVLKHALSKHSLATEQVAALLRVARSIDSSFEAAGVLVEVPRQHLENGEVQSGYVDLASHIDTDFERARALVSLAARVQLRPAALTAALAVIRNMDSDFEMSRILAALIHEQKFDDEQLIQALGAIEAMDSDFEKAKTLVSVAHMVRGSETVRDAYVEVADGIDSEFEYGRVMKALRARGDKRM